MNGGFERMWKEAVVTYVEVLSWHLARVTDEDHVNSHA
jgi:hypothetical protein